ncbi:MULTISPECIES: NIPSNAP family protein [Ramlibacter]|uniref:NIPSNAP family protein n=1 Tax=Ramlibacter pinisoli TaxID=2682844 RepID=A0A6N8IW09_9BURK|nr:MULTISPECIES: NIPSNAP family protein [Ramlibacter]MBA2961073.1 NIPSNAP family protein [Ramlibacter sp. CGMCC 1.13660]MVQ31017.1 NIPSNAP family protein [Ramlibacter pinisoli]
MIYEQRVYRALPGRLPKLLARMETDTLPLWEKHGIQPVGFFTTVVGESSNDLTYLLAWASMAEREARWGAFQADPEWKAKRAESEKDGPLLANISNTILAPTAFSRLK